MNYPIPAKTYSSASEMLAEGKARRERLMSANAPARRITTRSWSYAPAPLPAKPVCTVDYAFIPNVGWGAIVTEVSVKTGVSVYDILSPNREKHVVLARYEALYRTAMETTMSYPAIGRRFNRDHATIIHGIKKHALAHGLPFPKRMGASA